MTYPNPKTRDGFARASRHGWADRTRRARSLPFRGEFQQNASNVLAGWHKKAVPDARRNVDDIAYSERLRLATSERGPKIFAGRRTPSPLVHDHNIDDFAVFFGETVGVAIKQAEAMVTVMAGVSSEEWSGETFFISVASCSPIVDRVQRAKLDGSAANEASINRRNGQRRIVRAILSRSRGRMSAAALWEGLLVLITSCLPGQQVTALP